MVMIVVVVIVVADCCHAYDVEVVVVAGSA